MPCSIVVDHVSFAWPDGVTVLDRLDAAFPAGRTGLIGVNGSGKSTLLKIIAGGLTPRSGSVSVSGVVGHLPQNVPLGARRTVSDLLEISRTRAALHAIERGDVAEEHFTAVGDDWDVEERALAELDRLGLGHVGLDRTVGTLSGGETIMVALAAQLLKRPDALLLDEPTNNLDLDARRRLYAAVAAWQGVLLVVSHDRALLELVDQIAELREGAVRMYGGNLGAYEEQVAAEREAAERSVRTAEAEQAVRGDAEIRIELPRTEVPAGRTVLALPLEPPRRVDADSAAAVLETLVVRGPERIALLGPNGSGKTTLLRRIVAHGAQVPVRYLPQRLDLLDDGLSVVDNVRALAPSAPVNDVRARLARFLFRGERADQAAGTLSGGERFRATLAALLSAEPPPQLLLLDEPTNNLDMASVRRLAQALSAYRGALIVASHDLPFLETLGITRRLRQDREEGLTES
ncbi:ATPase subunit of ABC transporter with duplicated ATPase domains [Nonomuraea thailandensis]|uniref:ATPase subunit of ABC transporter with duplicated ATPase domains n=1 Tax=Nonomuraea thailandensis TaxID=1188745 RepID=A0A9X2K383_9ACTN|nr:ATP-binding cassette domain-containing protein [Nonomuraea thailandensis]MCP2359197.1 ATPase subunit of ABC transporter with duplicated ATPase domains [Nonomuraea thailandensis]